MRYFLFLDESGDHGLRTIDENFPVFVLCGVLISEPAYTEMRDNLNLIKRELWHDKKVIFHSRDIRKCQQEFQLLFDLSIKEYFYTAVNNVLKNADYKIISSAIRKEDFIKKYGRQRENVYEIALSFVLERSVFYLDELPDKNIKLEVIIEKRGKKEDQKLEQHFQRVRGNGTYFVSQDRFSKYGFGFHFRKKSENVNGLQVADLIAYPIARYVLDRQRANPAFEIIEQKIYGRNKKYGLKIFP